MKTYVLVYSVSEGNIGKIKKRGKHMFGNRGEIIKFVGLFEFVLSLMGAVLLFLKTVDYIGTEYAFGVAVLLCLAGATQGLLLVGVSELVEDVRTILERKADRKREESAQ